MFKKLLITLTISVLTQLLTTRSTIAQRQADDVVMRYSGTLSSSDSQLDDGSYYDVHTFSGREGDQVRVTLTSSDFDTFLMVLDPSGEVVEQNDDMSSGSTDSSLNIVLNDTGEYRIVANSYDSSGRGRYNIVADIRRPAASNERSVCPEPRQEIPSSTSREITNDEYGLSFEVPSNYSALLERNSDGVTIVVRNPADVRFLDCVTQNRMIGAGQSVSDIRVTAKPIPPGIQRLSDIVPSSTRDLQVRSSSTTIAGREAVIYDVQSSYPLRTRTAVLMHSDGLSLIEISISNYGESLESVDTQVFDSIISTLETDASRVANAVPVTSSSRLTLEGLGAIKFGMTIREAELATGMRFILGRLINPDWQCYHATLENGPEGLSFMVLNGEIVRVDVNSRSSIETLSGVGAGDSEDSVFSTYPGLIEVSPAGRGNYLNYTPQDTAYGMYGLTFHTTPSNGVLSFRAGFREAVDMIEGCIG